jgi:hypothetical protein
LFYFNPIIFIVMIALYSSHKKARGVSAALDGLSPDAVQADDSAISHLLEAGDGGAAQQQELIAAVDA